MLILLCFVACRNCQSDKPLTTLEEGLSYSAPGTEWKLIVTQTGAQWISDTGMAVALKDDNSIDVSALARPPIHANQDDSNGVSNTMSTETREQLSSLPLDDENLHQAMREAGEDPAALSADKSQVTLAFHPNIIKAYSKLQSLQGDLQHVEISAAESADTWPLKCCFCVYQHGPQLRTQPTLRSSPRMCRIMASGPTPSVGLS